MASGAWRHPLAKEKRELARRPPGSRPHARGVDTCRQTNDERPTGREHGARRLRWPGPIDMFALDVQTL